MDRERLAARLNARFDGQGAAPRVVARQAGDLADAGLFAEDFGSRLTVEDVVGNLADAPDGYSLVERWNWWLGSLDVSHGGYARFYVRSDGTESSGEN